MSGLKRLKSEYQKLTLHPTEGIAAGPINDDNILVWKAAITGPPGTCYEGGVFNAKLLFPKSYPMKPPKMQFTSEMFHPNVYQDGRICISILHTPGDDPAGYEVSAERWTPVQSVEKILLSVVSLLAEPNCESPANMFAAKLWRTDREQYNAIVKRLVQKTQSLP